MRPKLGISEAGLKRIARSVKQGQQWQSRFDSPSGGVETSTAEIQQWIQQINTEIESLKALQPAESFQNLQSWIEYLNTELEGMKASMQSQVPVDYEGAEAAFSGEAPATTQQITPSDPSMWESIKKWINQDVAQQVPRSQYSQNPNTYY
jgi:hypothetical protein